MALWHMAFKSQQGVSQGQNKLLTPCRGQLEPPYGRPWPVPSGTPLISQSVHNPLACHACTACAHLCPRLHASSHQCCRRSESYAACPHLQPWTHLVAQTCGLQAWAACRGDKLPAPADLINAVRSTIEAENLTIVIEPGRSMVAASGALVCR